MRPGERAEILRKEVQGRFESELAAALRRKLPSEGKLGGALRALFPFSHAVRAMMTEAAVVLVKRSSFDRELYAAAVRCLAQIEDKRATSILKSALLTEEAGGLATLSASCFSRDPALSGPLTKVAASRRSELAFGAEVARIARGESSGTHLATLAPKIKESHRIALCVEVLLPLTRGPALPLSIAAPLAVLRDAERHLGRWLVLAEIAARAGDERPLEEARKKAIDGPESSRAAWSLVAWALDPRAAHPSTRPTVELVARLSDRPSADRDTSFLFRLAASGAPSARPMLEGLAKKAPFADEVAIRAAMYLVRDHHKAHHLEAIVEALSGKHEHIRGVALAALWDLGDRERVAASLEAVESSPRIGTVAWAALVGAARSGKYAAPMVLDESTFRRVQWGWVE